MQRPLFIVENNRLLVKKSHIRRLGKEIKYRGKSTKDTKDTKEKSAIDFNDLLMNGIVEFLDVEEEETCMISMSLKDLSEAYVKCFVYTHCEIHPVIYFFIHNKFLNIFK